MADRFNFTGTFEQESVDKLLKRAKTKKGNDYTNINFSIVAAKNNRAFVELMGVEGQEIKGFDRENNKITVAWADRKDPEILKSITNKYTLALGGERFEFASPYDFDLAIAEHFDELKGKLVTVTGRLNKNYYNGKFSDRFQMNGLYVAAEDAKPHLEVSMDYYYNKDSVDGADFKDEKKVYINGYVSQYLDGKNQYVSHQLVINANKLDFENEQQMARLDMLLKVFGAKRDGMKITSAMKNTNYYKMALRTAYLQGAEEISFDEDSLTDFQKDLLKSGTSSLRDMQPKGQAYGQRVTFYNVTNVLAHDEYADGPVEVGKAKEFEEEIYAPVAQETVKDLEKDMNPPEEKKEETDTDWDLFS